MLQVRIIAEFRTQTSLSEGCNAILRHDCLVLAQVGLLVSATSDGPALLCPGLAACPARLLDAELALLVDAVVCSFLEAAGAIGFWGEQCRCQAMHKAD